MSQTFVTFELKRYFGRDRLGPFSVQTDKKLAAIIRNSLLRLMKYRIRGFKASAKSLMTALAFRFAKLTRVQSAKMLSEFWGLALNANDLVSILRRRAT